LKERIVAEPDSGNDVAGAESDLLCLSKEFVHTTIQGQFPDVLDGDLFLRPDLACIKNIKVELVFS
jgi:hypothetical protein